MTQVYFEELMESLGAKGKDGLAFGVKDGYPFSAEILRAGDSPQVLVRFVVNTTARTTAQGLAKEKAPHTAWHAESDAAGGALAAVYSPPSDFYLKAGVAGILADGTKALKEAGAAPPEGCLLCGQAGCDCLAWLEDGLRPAHTQCLHERLALPEEDAASQKQVKGSVWRGIAGALIGAAIAAAPIWTLMLNRGRVYWILFAFIPLLSGLLYRTLKGKASLNVAALSVLGASLLATFALEQVWYWLILTTTYNVTIPFTVSIQHYLASHTLALALREMLFNLLALVAGYLAISIVLRRYVADGTEITRARHGKRFVQQTALPLQSGGDVLQVGQPTPPEMDDLLME